jgi:hypothetical protein
MVILVSIFSLLRLHSAYPRSTDTPPYRFRRDSPVIPSAKPREATSLPRRNAAQKRHSCTARRRRAEWRQARAPTSCCTIGAVATVEATARPSPARQGEGQVCQRVSPKTPHPQGARACEQRERVRPSKLPRIFETLLIATQRAKTLSLGAHCA